MDSRKKKPPRLQLLGLIIGAAVMVGFTVAGIVWMLSLNSPDKLAAFQQSVEALGVGGWFVLLAIQYIQIVAAFIPGGPIQIVAGALYGPWGGLAVCLAGTVLAAASIFALVSRFGHKIISLFVDERDILQYRFLQDAKKLELLVIALFFIPGTPKDALTYLFALTPIPMGRFLLLSTCARVPAMLTSLFAGDSIVQGDWLRAAILFLCITCISALGLFLSGKIKRFYSKRHSRDA